MSGQPIYLDYAASSPVDPAVADAMCACLRDRAGAANPSSEHTAGAAARRVIDAARSQIGARVNAPPERILFTSGATESNNLALKGIVGPRAHARVHLVTTRIEHRSVLDTAQALAAAGAELTLLDCDGQGRVTPEQVAGAIRDDTALVSVMHVNNEIGSVQDIAAIAAACHARDVPLHVDAAQSAGKLALDLAGAGVDLCSLSAHKLCGPKGIGALYVRHGLTLAPLLHGGEQELGLRPGTLATHQVVGMGLACELADPAREAPKLRALRARLWAGLESIDGAAVNGSAEEQAEYQAPHILNVRFPGVDGESLRLALAGIAVSSGSACASASPDASSVLTSLGLGEALAQSSLRFGVGRFTTTEEIDEAVARVREAVHRLRSVSIGAPAWCSS